MGEGGVCGSIFELALYGEAYPFSQCNRATFIVTEKSTYWSGDLPRRSRSLQTGCPCEWRVAAAIKFTWMAPGPTTSGARGGWRCWTR